jgi:branched-chain amino acid transport system permease protein
MFGPVLGAIVLIILEELLSSATVYWPLILGAILIAVVLFARGGLEGALAMLERRK